MRRSHHERERRDQPEGLHDGEEVEKSPLQRIWFRALLGAVALLGLAFIVLPYLVESTGPASTPSPALEATPPVPSEPARVSLISRRPPPSPAPQRPEATTRPEPASTTAAAGVAAGAGGAAGKSSVLPAPRSEEPRIRQPEAPLLSKEQFWVQVGAFEDGKHAARFAARLAAEHYPVVVRRGESATVPHVVRIGRYPSRERAEEVRAALETKGFRGFVLRDPKR